MRQLIAFENRYAPVIPRRVFFRRLARGIIAGSGLVVISLAAGMAGYHFFESLSWLDAFVNASMILSGMGPLANPQTVGGRLFAGCYALYSGLVVIIVAGLIFAPVFHRFLHKFHVDEQASTRKQVGGEGETNEGDGSRARRSAPSTAQKSGGRTRGAVRRN